MGVFFFFRKWVPTVWAKVPREESVQSGHLPSPIRLIGYIWVLMFRYYEHLEF